MTEPTSQDLLARLHGVIESRLPAHGGDPEKSYVARLFSKGTDAILKKVGEEATETVMAGKDGDRQKIVYEVADLWFHSMIALAHFGLQPADVLAAIRAQAIVEYSRPRWLAEAVELISSMRFAISRE